MYATEVPFRAFRVPDEFGLLVQESVSSPDEGLSQPQCQYSATSWNNQHSIGDCQHFAYGDP